MVLVKAGASVACLKESAFVVVFSGYVVLWYLVRSDLSLRIVLRLFNPGHDPGLKRVTLLDQLADTFRISSLSVSRKPCRSPDMAPERDFNARGSRATVSRGILLRTDFFAALVGLPLTFLLETFPALFTVRAEVDFFGVRVAAVTFLPLRFDFAGPFFLVAIQAVYHCPCENIVKIDYSSKLSAPRNTNPERLTRSALTTFLLGCRYAICTFSFRCPHTRGIINWMQFAGAMRPLN